MDATKVVPVSLPGDLGQGCWTFRKRLIMTRCREVFSSCLNLEEVFLLTFYLLTPVLLLTTNCWKGRTILASGFPHIIAVMWERNATSYMTTPLQRKRCEQEAGKLDSHPTQASSPSPSVYPCDTSRTKRIRFLETCGESEQPNVHNCKSMRNIKIW